MGIALEYNLSDIAKAQQKFKNLAAVNTQPLMAEIGEYILSETQLNFEQEQTPDGEAWQPSQRASRDNGKTLQDHRHLYDSYTYEAANDSVDVGSNSEYAAIHHQGGQAGRNLAVTIEARPALGMNDTMEADIGDMALDFVAEAFA